jgi:hypothetical protein
MDAWSCFLSPARRHWFFSWKGIYVSFIIDVRNVIESTDCCEVSITMTNHGRIVMWHLGFTNIYISFNIRLKGSKVSARSLWTAIPFSRSVGIHLRWERILRSDHSRFCIICFIQYWSDHSFNYDDTNHGRDSLRNLTKDSLSDQSHTVNWRTFQTSVDCFRWCCFC